MTPAQLAICHILLGVAVTQTAHKVAPIVEKRWTTHHKPRTAPAQAIVKAEPAPCREWPLAVSLSTSSIAPAVDPLTPLDVPNLAPAPISQPQRWPWWIDGYDFGGSRRPSGIPETATWVSMIIGFGFVGAAMRRASAARRAVKRRARRDV